MIEIKNELTAKDGGLIIREGAALPLHEPKIIIIGGILDSPFKWLEKRIGLVDQKEAHVLVDRNKMSIQLVTDETNHYRTEITGKLEFHPAFIKFEINSGAYKSTTQMADLIKMNRTFFENHTIAMSLVSALKNFKATIDKALEKSDNNRGSRKILIDQVVSSNVPETFSLSLPIFKGQPKETIEVEVYFNPDDLTCTLISPQASDCIETTMDSAIDLVLKSIIEISPDIAILER